MAEDNSVSLAKRYNIKILQGSQLFINIYIYIYKNH